MNLFVDYIQPLTSWLQANPHWSFFITFFVSLTESLAIIGSIVPGSVTMTAIGILAGSGVLRIDMTLLAAILGAVSGDGLSYALGYIYSEQLTDKWPFRNYPSWLKYGKEFFQRHGAKSVFFGRFVGPLRSIIPVIAGIMHMKHWPFFVANVLSAIGWSVMYVMPGVVIGAASQELSAESATRFFLLILILLAGIWFVSALLKWAFKKLHIYFKKNFHQIWLGLKKHPILFRLFHAITPINEENHYPTVVLMLMILMGSMAFIVLLILNMKTQYLNLINAPVHLLIQSFHTHFLEIFFIFCTQLTSRLSIILLFTLCCTLFIYRKNVGNIIFLASTLITSGIIALALSNFFYTSRPTGLLVTMTGSSFLATNLEVASAFYGYILLLTKDHSSYLSRSLRIFIFITLCLSGIGTVYLGDYWLTDAIAAFLCGFTIAMIHYLMFRKYNNAYENSDMNHVLLCTFSSVLLLSSLLSTFINFTDMTHNHTPFHKEFQLDELKWWDQSQPILPLYRFNRIGKPTSLLNIQYSGDLDFLSKRLINKGWVVHTDSLLTNFITRMSKNSKVKMPLLSQLFDNKRPALIMTYVDSNSRLILELRVWESNYHLIGLNKAVWIGSVHQSKTSNPKSNSKVLPQLINPLTFVLPALNDFTVRRIELQKEQIKSTTLPTKPYILLIKPSSS